MARRHPVTSDTLGHWRFDGATGENEPDDSGNEHDVLDVPGNIPAVASNPFDDGTTSRDCTNVGRGNEAFNLNPNPAAFGDLAALTVSTFFYLSTETSWMDSGWWAHLFKAGQPPGGHSGTLISLYPVDGKAHIRGWVECTGASVNINGGAVSAGWHLATMVFSADNYGRLYVDAALVGEDLILGGNAYAATGELWLGGGEVGGAYPLHGYLSDTIIYNTAKSADWVNGIWRGAGFAITSVGLTFASTGRQKKLGPKRRM